MSSSLEFNDVAPYDPSNPKLNRVCEFFIREIAKGCKEDIAKEIAAESSDE